MPDPRIPDAARGSLSTPSTYTEELRSFLFFTVVMAPLIAVIGVGALGFVIWMYQLVAGPPTA
jgi:nitrate reductase NapE